MEISFYNTLTHSTQPFAPLDAPDIYMYNCGPTVYDYAHIGNFRSFLFSDVLRRFLELIYGQDNVHQVMNLTDVGHMTEDQLADGGGVDKMAAAATRLKQAKKQGTAQVENPDDPYQVAQFFINAFIEDGRALGLKVADDYPKMMPRATEYIQAMQNMVATLIEKDHAYVASDGAVYFDVQSFPAYGQLSGNTLDQLRGGAGGRVLDQHQEVKRHPSDFLLWKPDDTHIMKWDSPWGTGYPGWHIECSAMASELLGREVIDIHTGGEDNLFPHHECEIAQACGASGESHFAKFWMHARHLMVEGEKMSKSKGNFFTIRDLMEKGIDPVVIRYELIKTHYRANSNFTFKGLEDSGRAVQRLRELAANLEKQAAGQAAEIDLTHPMLEEFTEALADDLNIAGALGTLFKWVGSEHDNPAESLAALKKVDMVLGVLEGGANVGDEDHDSAIAKAKELDQARVDKDYANADRLRQELIEDGYTVKTTSTGTAIQTMSFQYWPDDK